MKQLSEFYSTKIFLAYSTRTAVKCPSINFVLNSLEDAEFFIEFGGRSHNLERREERLFGL